MLLFGRNTVLGSPHFELADEFWIQSSDQQLRHAAINAINVFYRFGHHGKLSDQAPILSPYRPNGPGHSAIGEALVEARQDPVQVVVFLGAVDQQGPADLGGHCCLADQAAGEQ